MGSHNTFEFPYRGDMVKGYMVESRYYDDNMALTLMGWDNVDHYWAVWARLSINTDHVMSPGEFVANHDCTELVADLANLGLFELTDKKVSYGYVEDQPVYRLTEKGREVIVLKVQGQGQG